MLIRRKLMLNALLGLGTVVLIFVLQLQAQSTQEELDTAVKHIVELERDLLRLRKDEKDFFTRLDDKYTARHQKDREHLATTVASLSHIYAGFNVSQQLLDEFMNVSRQYTQSFDIAAQLQIEIGMTPKSGLYGELRQAVHNVESKLKQEQQDALTVLMLQLRRNEKDFMLRRDVKYLDRFNNNIELFSQRLKVSGVSSETQREISSLMQVYQNDFRALVEREQQLGLGDGDGLKGQLSQLSAQMDKLFVALNEKTLAVYEAETSRNTMISLGVFACLAAVLAVFTVAIIRSIVNPVEQITALITRVETERDLTLRCDTSRQDELGQIALHFNNMLENFQALIRQVNDSVTQVNDSCLSLSETARKSSDGITSQLNETDMVATAITEMGATIEEIANSTELAAGKAAKTHENAQQGQHAVQHTITMIQTLADKLDDSGDVVSELAKDGETIGQVLDVIRGIADQTNLLALNAAIEAARAGEQGRGFAVVADEVRSLAMRTQESTNEIATIIDNLQTRTQTVVSMMQTSQRQGNDSVAQAAAAGDALEQINQDISNIMDMSTQIAAAIEQQSMVANEVNKNVLVIRDVAESSSKAAIVNAKDSATLEDKAAELLASVSRFKA
ncbi:methyl-accepting chemotaxis protein [Shewanella corallii]|uniref:Methyl-accepting chemotaxis protein n=1 Tax=Shewanella corallii TaxID=560080 RepID=A0ABT0NDF0_9GAMM|nr:methyl-accepting chemotaxis protein [Shewanella corallii]MCL2915841.1 methyl-accepting chemotaxis protein [Shewanella corallii]